VFHGENPQRLDYERIMELIPSSASVLDLGCGTGGLLRRLADLPGGGHRRLVGLELDQDCVIECVRSGLDVIRTDLNDGLASFRDGQFDVVVLSHTLQTIRDVDGVIGEMLRVGGRCIVSFPNFAYYKLREMLFHEGRAPVSGGLLSHSWYNTPNMRFFTIADFQDYCAARSIAVHECIFLDTESGREAPPDSDPNSAADMAIFTIGRNA
jgi:homoserine O-acetyltransferase